MAAKKTTTKSRLKILTFLDHVDTKIPPLFTGIAMVIKHDSKTGDPYLGVSYWYKKGKIHRDDGPAQIWYSGLKEWYKNGNRHREDGPAVVSSDRTKEWFLDGKEYSENEWKMKLRGEELPPKISTPPATMEPKLSKATIQRWSDDNERSIPLPQPVKSEVSSWSQYGIDSPRGTRR